MRGRGGYTLIELVVASTVTVVVMAQIFFVVLGLRRLISAAYAQGDLALAAHEMRERLYYRLTPDSEKYAPGAASLEMTYVDTVAMGLSGFCFANSSFDGEGVTRRIMWNDGKVVVENVPATYSWLTPARLDGDWDSFAGASGPGGLEFRMEMSRNGATVAVTNTLPAFPPTGIPL